MRPLDDQSIERNRLEAEAVASIALQILVCHWEMVSSDALELEIRMGTATERQEFATGFLAMASAHVIVGVSEFDRMDELAALGFKANDALHIACAEVGKCGVLLTTDDRMRKRADRFQARIGVRVMNPVAWLKEQSNV